jgi:hypothetical protein
MFEKSALVIVPRLCYYMQQILLSQLIRIYNPCYKVMKTALNIIKVSLMVILRNNDCPLAWCMLGGKDVFYKIFHLLT